MTDKFKYHVPTFGEAILNIIFLPMMSYSQFNVAHPNTHFLIIILLNLNNIKKNIVSYYFFSRLSIAHVIIQIIQKIINILYNI